jgi:hypothetical protein
MIKVLTSRSKEILNFINDLETNTSKKKEQQKQHYPIKKKYK